MDQAHFSYLEKEMIILHKIVYLFSYIEQYKQHVAKTLGFHIFCLSKELILDHKYMCYRCGEQNIPKIQRGIQDAVTYKTII